MRQTEFQKMIDIEEEADMDKLKEGDFFLYGKNVVAQKQHKNVGDEISYYEVIAKVGKDVSYAPVFDILKEDK